MYRKVITCTDRLSRIGGMFPVGKDAFFSRMEHTNRVTTTAVMLNDIFFNSDKEEIRRLANCHDFGRIPFIHYLEKFLNNDLGIKYNQSTYRKKQFKIININSEIISAIELLDRRDKIQGQELEQLKNNTSQQTVRIVYYADKLTGFIEDTLFGYKLGYYKNSELELINGFPKDFIELFYIDEHILELMSNHSKDNFNDICKIITDNFLYKLKENCSTETDIFSFFENIIFSLNRKIRESIMEPIIFKQQNLDIQIDFLKINIFKPVVLYLLQCETENNTVSLLDKLVNMSEKDFLLIAATIKPTIVNDFYRILNNIQSRFN